MSAKSRGLAFEKKVKSLMEDTGFTVEMAHPKLKFIGKGRTLSVSHDIFGCIDLHGIHPNRSKSWYIQCTISGSGIAEKKRKIEAVSWNHNIHEVQIWRRLNNKRDIRMYRYGVVKNKGLVWSEYDSGPRGLASSFLVEGES